MYEECNMSDREYSGPRLDVTAEELRRGEDHAIPETIPDCAWVPRDSIKPGREPVTGDDKWVYTEPFCWNELNPGAAPGSPDRVLKREEAVT